MKTSTGRQENCAAAPCHSKKVKYHLSRRKVNQTTHTANQKKKRVQGVLVHLSTPSLSSRQRSQESHQSHF